MVLDSTVKSKKEKKTTLFSHGLRGLMNIHKSHDIPHTACKFKNYENVRKKGLKKSFASGNPTVPIFRGRP